METVLVNSTKQITLKQPNNKVVVLLTCLLIPLLTLISPILSVVFVYCYGFYLLLKSNHRFLIFFICFIFIQNITLMTCADKFTSSTHTLFSLSKEIMLYVFCAKSLFLNKNKIQNKPIIIITCLFIGLCLISFFVSDAPFFSRVISIRQLFLPFVCFYFGFFLDISNDRKKQIFSLIVKLSIITSILGFIEFIFLKDVLWLKLPIQQYQINKGTEFALYNGVPLNFYTWDFKDMTGLIVRRLVSVFGDPLITAHFLFLGFAVTNLTDLKRKPLIKSILFVAAILTFSKGVYVCFAIYFLLKIIRKLSYVQFKRLFFIVFLVGILSISSFVAIVSKIAPTSSILIHVNGLIKGITGTSFFGAGVGKAGVMVSIKTGIDRLTGESYVGIISSQIGFVGLILYCIFAISIIFCLYYMLSVKEKKDFLIPLCLLFSVFAESFFSESSVGIVATGLYFVIAGFAFSQYCRTTTAKSVNVNS